MTKVRRLTHDELTWRLGRHRIWLAAVGGERLVLEDVDLSGADLSGAVLRGACMTRVDLSGAGLSGADLRGAILSGVDLSGADLSGADLSGTCSTCLRGLNFGCAILLDANLMGARLDDVELGASRVERVQIDARSLREATFGGVPVEPRNANRFVA